MKVYNNALQFRDHVPTETPVVLTIGTFDGVHAGHRAVLHLVSQRAARLGAETVLLTFDPHPRMVLHPESHGLALLNSQLEKQELLSQTGLNHLVVQPFTLELSRKSPLEYVRELIGEGIRPAVVVVGYDHRFGRNREGDFTILTELGQLFNFEVEELPAQHVDDTQVSSTKVRSALQSGDIDLANHWLQSPYIISGRVISGDQIGRTMGFPTANLGHLPSLKLIPGNGVYFGWGQLPGQPKWPALINIGRRPTISAEGPDRIEAHLIGFEGECYEMELTLTLETRIRDERKFEDRTSLLEAIESDLVWAQRHLQSMQQPPHP